MTQPFAPSAGLAVSTPGGTGSSPSSAAVTVAAPGFTQPLVGSSVSIPVNASANLNAPGDFLSVTQGGIANVYAIVSVPDGTHVVAMNLNSPTNAAPGTAMTAGNPVTVGAPLNVWAQDLATSAAFAQWIASISGTYGGLGPLPNPVPIHVDTLEFDSARAPAIVEDTTGSTFANPIDVYTQTTTDPAGAPGDFRIVVGTGGFFGKVKMCTGHPSIPFCVVKPDGNDFITSLSLFPLQSGFDDTRPNSETLAVSAALGLQINSLGGSISFTAAGVVLANLTFQNNFVMGGSVTVGGGQGVFGLETAIIAPTVAPTNGILIFSRDGTDAFFRGTDGIDHNLNGTVPTTAPIATTGGTVTLNAAQIKTELLVVTGTLASNLTIVVPNQLGWWTFDLGAVVFGIFSVTFKSGASSSAAIVAANITGLAQLVQVVAEGADTVRINI